MVYGNTHISHLRFTLKINKIHGKTKTATVKSWTENNEARKIFIYSYQRNQAHEKKTL